MSDKVDEIGCEFSKETSAFNDIQSIKDLFKEVGEILVKKGKDKGYTVDKKDGETNQVE